MLLEGSVLKSALPGLSPPPTLPRLLCVHHVHVVGGPDAGPVLGVGGGDRPQVVLCHLPHLFAARRAGPWTGARICWVEVGTVSPSQALLQVPEGRACTPSAQEAPS